MLVQIAFRLFEFFCFLLLPQGNTFLFQKRREEDKIWHSGVSFFIDRNRGHYLRKGR